MAADDSITRTKLDIIYNDILGDVHELMNRLEGLKSHLPDAAQELKTKLNTVLEEIHVSVGVVDETGKKSTKEILQAANILRSETIVIIESAKRAAAESATFTAEQQGRMATNGILEKGKDERAGIRIFANDLILDIGKEVQNKLDEKLNVTLDNLAKHLNELIKPISYAKDDLNMAKHDLNIAKNDLIAAKEILTKTIKERALWTLGSVVLGVILTLGIAKGLGWLNPRISDEKINSIISAQETIYDKLNELEKLPPKNAARK